MRRMYGVVLVILMVTRAAHAQTTAAGSVRGVATDEHGSVVPGVAVIATSATVPGVFTATTDMLGQYRLGDLPPGDYTVIADLAGFARFLRTPVTVRAGLNVEADIVMKVGAIGETIEVRVETPLLETRNATQAVNISGELLRGVPLSEQREWYGALNLARVFYKEGRLDEAAAALHRAAGATPWTVAWLSGLVNKENGFLDQAIDDFTRVLASGPAAGAARRFDFSSDYEVINELGQSLFERAKVERGAGREESRRQYLRRAADQFEKTLGIDAENVTAHYVLSLIYGELGDARRSAEHAALHARYRLDDNARDHAIAVHRLANAAAKLPKSAIPFSHMRIVMR